MYKHSHIHKIKHPLTQTGNPRAYMYVYPRSNLSYVKKNNTSENFYAITTATL